MQINWENKNLMLSEAEIACLKDDFLPHRQANITWY